MCMTWRATCGGPYSTVRLWNIDSESPKHTCKGHSNWVLCIAWSPDGRVIASGSMVERCRLTLSNAR